jgi:tRNA(His) 5'-end guanylyltransferase
MLITPLGRPKNRWEDDIRNYIKKLKIKNWTNCIQDRKNWTLYVKKKKNSSIPAP